MQNLIGMKNIPEKMRVILARESRERRASTLARYCYKKFDAYERKNILRIKLLTTYISVTNYIYNLRKVIHRIAFLL